MPKVRVSTGTAIALELFNGKIDAAPTTAYLMTYKDGKCSANCAFCPQARNSNSQADMLSRISWPAFEANEVLDRLQKAFSNGKIKRVCLQALNYKQVFDDLLCLVGLVRQKADIPVSVSCQPLTDSNISRLASSGIDRIGIPLDGATACIFDKIKGKSTEGPYQWDEQLKLLTQAVQVFGKGKVSTHLILGLGESEQEMVATIQTCFDMGVLPALFAFTPVRGTSLEKQACPELSSYRRIQLARWAIVHNVTEFEKMKFSADGRLLDFGISSQALESLLNDGDAFRTSGCPECNRPFYNERPSGPIYNYPQKLTEKDISNVKKQLELQ